ncbi:MAG TPA: hypothetical protein VF275_01835 [Gammaproteobacteria bacterium]
MAEHRQEFMSRLSAELDAIDAQLDQFRAEFRDESTMGAKFRTDDKLETLEQRRDAIRQRSRELEDADGDRWEASRRDIENARNDLRRSLDEARNHLRH